MRGEIRRQEDFYLFNDDCAVYTSSVSGYAAATYGMRCTTLDANISYLKPAIGSKVLYGEAKEVKRGRTVLVFDVYVTDDTGLLIAKSTVTYYNLGVPIPETEEEEDNLKEKREKNAAPEGTAQQTA